MAKTIVLDSTSKSLQAFTTSTSGATIDYVTTWADSTSSTFTEGESDGQLTGSTPATIVAAPASSTRRVVKAINLYNAGTYSEIVTITLVNSANTRVIVKVTIAPGVTWTSDDLITYTTGVTNTVLAFRNALINGDFQISQRSTPSSSTSGTVNEYLSTSDYAPFNGSYTHDRWIIQHQQANAAGFSVSRRMSGTSGNVPGTQVNSCAIKSLATASTAGKVGLLQIIEASNCVDLVGSPATLSFWAKRDSTVGSTITNVKAAILYWTGTVNATPRIIVSSWNATDTIPTFISNLTAAVVSPASYNVTSTWARYTLTTPFIPASAQNIAVFIWNDRIDRLSTDELFLADVQLERGLTASTFEVLPLSTIQARCYRYFYAVYGIAPATGAALTYGPVALISNPQNPNRKIFLGTIPFPQPMRANPSGFTKALVSGSAYDVVNSANVSQGVLARPFILTASQYQMDYGVDTGVSTTLTAAITSTTQTTITVSSNTAFPATGVIQIGDELIRYLGKSGTTQFTQCTRGFSGTTAATASNGALVQNTFNALATGAYTLRHSGATPSFFTANAEL